MKRGRGSAFCGDNIHTSVDTMGSERARNGPLQAQQDGVTTLLPHSGASQGTEHEAQSNRGRA